MGFLIKSALLSIALVIGIGNESIGQTVQICTSWGCYWSIPNSTTTMCTGYGCPQNNPVYLYPYPTSNHSQIIIIPQNNPYYGSNGNAIAQCIDQVMYRTEINKPTPQWDCSVTTVGCQTVRIPTGVSQSAAVFACQNAR